MVKKKILIIEDDPDIQELIVYNLGREGYDVHAVTSAEEGLALASSWEPDLVLLDLMLPGMDGLDACRKLKTGAVTSSIPVIMVTAKGEEADIVSGLELGAEDYIVKPFSPRVLVARIRTVLRRDRQQTEEQGEEALVLEDLTIHPGRRKVFLSDRPVDLTFTEFNILHLLAGKRGWVFTRGQIVNAVRGHDYHVTERTIDVHILSLRRKLGARGDLIETIRGVGYRLKE